MHGDAVMLDARHRILQKRQRRIQLARFGTQQRLIDERRQSRLLTFFQQTGGKAIVIMSHHRTI